MSRLLELFAFTAAWSFCRTSFVVRRFSVTASPSNTTYGKSDSDVNVTPFRMPRSLPSIATSVEPCVRFDSELVSLPAESSPEEEFAHPRPSVITSASEEIREIHPATMIVVPSFRGNDDEADGVPRGRWNLQRV